MAAKQLERIFREGATPRDLAVSAAHLQLVSAVPDAPAQMPLFPPRAG